MGGKKFSIVVGCFVWAALLAVPSAAAACPPCDVPPVEELVEEQVDNVESATAAARAHAQCSENHAVGEAYGSGETAYAYMKGETKKSDGYSSDDYAYAYADGDGGGVAQAQAGAARASCNHAP